MTSPADLQFDKMKVDTKLAEEYIKRSNSVFHCIDASEKEEHKYDAVNNKIYCYDTFNKSNSQYMKGNGIYDTSLVSLANLIEDNVNLFCQLEFLIRQKPIVTTTLELKMIIKYLRYQASSDKSTMSVSAHLVMKNDTPLIELGWIARMAAPVNIVAAENVAVVCHLFTNLCRTSGLNGVNLGFASNSRIISDNIGGVPTNKALRSGCVGVLTTQSDVGSAVDVFLSAPQGDLWGLRRILVQESVLERFKTEFAWKTRFGSQGDVDPKLKSLCTDVYVHDGRIFLREYVGDDTNLQNIVPIESYRTVKELLTLIESYSPFCVSLWCHGVAESNEIAFGISSVLVWVNRYGVLGYPNWTCLPYFSQVHSFEMNPEMSQVKELQKSWAKLSHDERRKKALAGLKETAGDEEFEGYVRCVRTAGDQDRNLVYVGAGDLVIAERKPRDVYAIKWNKNFVNATDVIHGLLGGCGFLISIPSGADASFRRFLSRLTEVGLPIVLSDFEFPPDTFPLEHTARVVHTGFGTIFAN